MREKGCCAFNHPSNIGGTKGVISKKKWGGKRRLLQNSFTTNNFRIWLPNTFSLEYLKTGVVLDVGGGKGELSWMLLNLMGVDSVVVDPRQLQLQNIQTSWSKGMFEPLRIGPIYSATNPEVVNGSKDRPSLVPKHLRILFRRDEIHTFLKEGPSPSTQDWLDGARKEARDIAWTTRGLKHHEDGNEGEAAKEEGVGDSTEVEVTDITTEVMAGGQLFDLLQQSKLIVGLHPDQAAGEIAQTAIAMRIGFAIVPCCVYSSEFPKRKLKNGKQVSNHQDLVQFIKELHPKCKTCTLDFEGKNICVYLHPEDI